jgi:3-hydroxyacyl-CoA dehydrogenase
LRQVVTDAGRLLPSAVVRSDRRTVMVNMAEESAIALAHQAKAQGITQKQLVCRALKAAGVPMDPLDLEDRTPRRRAA